MNFARKIYIGTFFATKMTITAILDIDPSKYEVRNIGIKVNGNIKDVFNPQSRCTHLHLYAEEEPNSSQEWIKEAKGITPHLYVTGLRPRALNLGTKYFAITIFAREMPLQDNSHEGKKQMLIELSRFLTKN